MKRLIKKYKNRRLYDMEVSQYITVETLHQYVLQGIAFRVEDSINNKDITNLILLQILLEMEGSSSQFLSSDLLRQIIMLAHNPLNQAMRKMMEQFFINMESFSKPNADPLNFQKSSEKWQEWLTQWQKFV